MAKAIFCSYYLGRSMVSIHWQKTIGQERIKENFSRALENGQLGHAYLFAGKAGVGKFSLALELAMTLLCESDSKPCGNCSACRKVLGHSHADFRYLFPLVFGAEHKVKGQAQKLNDAGWDFISAQLKQKLHEPYITHQPGGTIPVDWIREMNHSIQRGATENGYTVVIIEGVDSFRAEAANAMLKTLEEPPAKTIMILLTESIHSVLPTIKSRCQIHRFGSIEPVPFENELTRRFPEQSDQVARIAPLSYGSLGKALSLMNSEDENDDHITRFFEILFNSSSPLQRALDMELFVEENLAKEFPRAMAIVNALIEECRFAFLHRYSEGSEFIFSPIASQQLQKLTLESVESLIKSAEDALLSLHKRTAILMVFVNLTLHLTEIIDE